MRYILIVLAMASFSFSKDLSGNSIFADHRARAIGDLIIVNINDNSSATNEAKTTTSNSGSLSLSAKGSGFMDFIPEMGGTASNSNSSSGSGKTERKGSVVAVVTARITDILTNGNLVISGDKVIEVNGEKQITSVSGVVRPKDINGDNEIYSNQIAGLEVSFTGAGAVADAEEPGIFTRFFNWLF
ncbi:MAG: hypothetical protein CR982_01605 [Candidatus Cloacimonadota bacterium]|nr:MAG: hypothetical protein CR982_01605 [Candidatus Cloacimonadota bacterium]PIE77461.1 MAG: hypothetical protein CSA15_12835 [Candidatus Delongbacteria bacterium]